MPSRNVLKDVLYLNKDFKTIRNNLIDFTKVYFPDDYQDFSQASTGMMMIEIASYVSDILSLYTDIQLRESFIQLAQNKTNVINGAYALGYIPKLGGVSYTTLDVYQVIPATGFPFTPDWRYALRISDLKAVSETNSDIIFRVDDVIDFAESGSYPTEITVYETNSAGDEVTYFLLKKSVPASSGIIVEKDFTITSLEKYLTIILPDNDIIDIVSVVDSNRNNWYQVPYLAQDTILESVKTELIDQDNLSSYSRTVPYLLRYKKVAKRFIKKIRADGRTEIQFGAGTSAYPDEMIIPNPKNVGYTYFNMPLDPRSFLSTRTYGQIPNNTTLTIVYVRGTDERANVATGDINIVTKTIVEIDDTGLDAALLNRVKSSVAVINSTPAVGSKGAETIEDIRNNALAYFSAQDRCVTREDYEIRILSMHPKYGSVAKVKIEQDTQILNSKTIQDNTNYNIRFINPLALNAYCLAYDSNKHLIPLNAAIKNNLKFYLDNYRMVTDAVNIKDAYIINIGVEFDIITFQNVVNKREVVLRCIDELKKYFDVDKWQIGQPIILSEIYNLLDNVDGVRTVVENSVKITNKYDSTGVQYSNNFYGTADATIGGVVFTSLDPSIWEVKYPNTDIFGRAV